MMVAYFITLDPSTPKFNILPSPNKFGRHALPLSLARLPSSHSREITFVFSVDEDEMRRKSHSNSKKQSSGILGEISNEGVKSLLNRANKEGSSGKRKWSSNASSNSSDGLYLLENEPERSGNKVVNSMARGESSGSIHFREEKYDDKALDHDSDWEDGTVGNVGSKENIQVTVELSKTPDTPALKRPRRATADDKDLAEQVHKVHLLCLIARGRLIDSACDDPLIQASLLSLVPQHLLSISKLTKLTIKALHPLTVWFHNNFHVRYSQRAEGSFRLTLASALEMQEGNTEEIAALFVALCRALQLTTRFVSILDVASLKPDLEKSKPFGPDAGRTSKGIFETSTLMVPRTQDEPSAPNDSFCSSERGDILEKDPCKSKGCQSKIGITHSRAPPLSGESNDRVARALSFKEDHDVLSENFLTEETEKLKRKGDLEFKMQLEMALSATSAVSQESNKESSIKDFGNNSLDFHSHAKGMKKVINEGSSSSPQEISSAVGSKKVGSPLYWAEVYCSGENLTGRWVHIDAVNLILDGEQKVEGMTSACKTSLRYVVAFAGQGAKDVTRRYCTKWHKIASRRVSSIWWDAVLAPLRELESDATGGMVYMETYQNSGTTGAHKSCIESGNGSSFVPNRSSLEDIELESRALTEPLPTNQQAYRNHQLYALEKWLTKYQVLHPKGPILGFCSGFPVYPRTCVQTLKTKDRWLRDGLQVKPNEQPMKELDRSMKHQKVEVSEADEQAMNDYGGSIKLFGRWQVEPLCLPPAVNGKVPKNERGQVDVWSEKCLPPGTVHLKLPRLFNVAKRLEIDYAPAMVGFEFRNGRSYPVFDGIVICSEFKDALLEAFAEEEDRRHDEEKKRDERQAVSRWYQLLSSVVNRQRLHNRYTQDLQSDMFFAVQQGCKNSNAEGGDSHRNEQTLESKYRDKNDDIVSSSLTRSGHEHVFLKEYEVFDEESCLLTKRCACGFSVQVEEL